jgi:hypothetical protein
LSYVGSEAFFLCDSLTIYSEHSSEPEVWEDDWNRDSRTVVWGYSIED